MKHVGKTAFILVAVILLVALANGCVKKNNPQDTNLPTGVTTTRSESGTLEATSATSEAGTQVGSIIRLGAYEQDDNTANNEETLEWRVLAIENGKALLIAEKILDCIPYNITNSPVSWETCTLRTWLNDEFLNSAFTADEREKISVTTLANADVTDSETKGGKDTQDKVFLLNYVDAEKYFEVNNSRMAQGTGFAKNKGMHVVSEGSSAGNSYWWLRSPGLSGNSGVVDGVGQIYFYNNNVGSITLGVRPALWITL